ncbi:armadillo-type protein [Dissophora ornata]|nr:armadillo-type protein [Dissophora ornata]
MSTKIFTLKFRSYNSGTHVSYQQFKRPNPPKHFQKGFTKSAMNSNSHDKSRPVSGRHKHSHLITVSASKTTGSRLQKGLDYIKDGDRYRDRGDFDKAKAKYEKASGFYHSEAHDRLTILPLCRASKASTENSDSRRYIPAGLHARFHHAKEKVKQVMRSPSQISTAHQYFFPLSTRSTLASMTNTDSQSASVSVSTCMSTSTLTIQSTVGTSSAFASEVVVSDVGIVSHVRSTTAAYNIAGNDAREIIDNKAYDIVKQFGKSRITFDTVQELVVLANIPDRDIFLHITTKILHVLRDMPLLTSIALQGLAVILDSFPDKIDLGSLHGTFVEILKRLQARLSDIRTANNIGELLPLLIALNSLLDAMVRRKASSLDRESVYDVLNTRLGSLTSHPNVTVCFQALYAKQALAIIGNDESLPMSVYRHGKLAFVLAGNISSMATKFDLASAESAYQNIKKIFDSSIKEHYWRQLEDFVLNSKFQSDVCFQLGVVLRLEEIAVVQTDTAIRNGAIKFLVVLGTKPIPLVPEMVQSTLRCLGISEGSTDGTNDDMAIPLPLKSYISKIYQDELRSVWDPAWHATPKGILLKAVQGRDQRNANVDNLPAQFMDIKQEIQSSGSKVKGAVDQIGADIQRLKADARASLPPQSSLEDIQFALKTYYAPYLFILRVSGDELDLETCFVNLAIVEAQAQRKKEKQYLKEQAAVFHRIPRRAGIGKTTLCKKLVLAHQTGLWRDRFDAILWLPLRRLKAFKTCTLEGLLREKFFTQVLDQEGVALARALASCAQKGRVLFILDGLDEIAADTEGNEGHDLRSFLRTLLRQQHVVITSRPSGLDRSLLPPIDLELETVGFSQQNVKDFLVKVLNPEAVRTVQDFIQQTPLIQGLVNIPVQLDVICFSWDSLPMDGPTITMTGLYQLMVRKLWCKDALRLGKTAGGKGLKEREINKLAPKHIDELMATELQHLGYLAFKGMKNNHQIEFNETALLSAFEDLRQFGATDLFPPQLLEMMNQTSFLHTADADLDANKSGSQQSWYFLHLTFQEYFAATWIAQHLQVKQPYPSARMMTVEQAKAFVQEHKYNPQYEIVWWMVSGLLDGEALEEFFGLLQGSPRDLIGGRHQQILASCLNEARARLDTTVVAKLDAELMKWLHFETQTCDSKGGGSILGSQTSFPETLLVENLGSVSSWKTTLVQTLEARSTLSEPAVQFLIGALKDEDADIRTSAASALGKQSMLPESVIRSLIGALKDEDRHVRRSAASALGRQSTLPESAIQSAIDALNDEDADVRCSAAEALGKQSKLPESAIQSLIGAFKDEDAYVRRSAASALHNQSTLPESALQSLVGALNDEDWYVRYSAESALTKQPMLPESGIKSLVGALNHEDADVKRSAASALGNQSALPQSGIQSLVDALKHENADVRRSAVSVLGNQSTLTELAIQSLISALKYEDTGVRRSAALVLGKQSTLPESAIQSLIGALKDKDRHVRGLVALALGKHSTLPESAIQSLVGALENEDRHVRRSVASALGKQSALPESAIQSLIGVLKDKDTYVRYSAADAFSKQSTLPESAIQSLISALKDEDAGVRRSAASALGKQSTLPKSAIQSLINALKYEDRNVRRSAASALGNQSTLPESAIQSLVGALEHEDAGVRYSAASVLGNQSMLPKSAIQSLVSALKKEHEDVRQSAASALGKQSTLPELAIQSLIGALKDEDAHVSGLAASALHNQSTLPESALQSLVGALKDEAAFVRRSAASALGSQSTLPESAIQSLIGALKDDDEDVRYSAVSALGRQSTLPESGIQSLVGALNHEDAGIRRSAASALGKHSTLPESAIQFLVGVLNHEDASVRYSAASALGKQSMLPESAIQSLIGALKHEDADVRRLAASALSKQSTLTESAIQSLIGALKHEDRHVRRSAASALGKQSTLPESAIQSLIGALKDEDEDVRRSAASALGKQSTLPESAIHSLIGALKEEGTYIRESAASALGNQSTLPESAIQSLISALKDGDAGVRYSAASVLGEQSILSESAIQSLVGALKDGDWYVIYIA